MEDVKLISAEEARNVVLSEDRVRAATERLMEKINKASANGKAFIVEHVYTVEPQTFPAFFNVDGIQHRLVMTADMANRFQDLKFHVELNTIQSIDSTWNGTLKIGWSREYEPRFRY